MSLITGDMVNRVRNSAIPTSTMLGGFCCSPMAERRKEREMIYRVKEVIITTIEGRSVIRVVRSRFWSV